MPIHHSPSAELGTAAHQYLAQNIWLYVDESNSKTLMPALLHTASLITTGELSFRDNTLRNVGAL